MDFLLNEENSFLDWVFLFGGGGERVRGSRVESHPPSTKEEKKRKSHQVPK